jgi:HNH endonuclease
MARRPKSPHKDTLPQRLARYVDSSGGFDACWPWNGFRNKLGYGRAWYRGELHLSHRLAWINAFGPVPAGRIVCHACDNPPCCNPKHLYAGTDQTNSDDKAARGRSGDRRGAANGHAELSSQQVVALRSHPGTHAAAGRAFGISATHASRIRRHLAWPHLEK